MCDKCFNGSILSTFFDGEMTEDDLIKVAKHVKKCFYCKGTLEEFNDISHTLQNSLKPVLGIE